MPIGRIRKPSQQTELNPVDVAKDAVAAYERELSVLEEMRESFKTEFPDAFEALQSIMRQEDVVAEKVKEAHSLVQQSKETVGDFKLQRKFKAARYDDEAVTRLVGEDEKAARVLPELIKAGAVKKISLDNQATNFFATHPAEAELFKTAWRDRQEMTPAVTDPKFGNLF